MAESCVWRVSRQTVVGAYSESSFLTDGTQLKRVRGMDVPSIFPNQRITRWTARPSPYEESCWASEESIQLRSHRSHGHMVDQAHFSIEHCRRQNRRTRQLRHWLQRFSIDEREVINAGEGGCFDSRPGCFHNSGHVLLFHRRLQRTLDSRRIRPLFRAEPDVSR